MMLYSQNWELYSRSQRCKTHLVFALCSSESVKFPIVKSFCLHQKCRSVSSSWKVICFKWKREISLLKYICFLLDSLKQAVSVYMRHKDVPPYMKEDFPENLQLSQIVETWKYAITAKQEWMMEG